MYKNQFIICNKNNKLNLQYNEIHLNKNRYLYFKNLEYKILNNSENRIIVIGFCLTSKNVDSFEKEFINIENKNIEDVLSILTGNYIVIYKDIIYKDFMNLQRLYTYKSKYNNEFFISNNPLIFRNVFHFNLGDYKKFGGNFRKHSTAGKTCFSKVKALYNSQNIDIYGNITYNKILKLNENDKINLNDFLNIYTKYCKNVLLNLYNQLVSKNKKLFLALTGGKDSRMILSILLDLKIPFTVLTLKIIKDDYLIASEICKKFNLEHHIINFDDFEINQNKKNIFENIIREELLEEDNKIIQKCVFEKYLNDGDCIIFGNGPAYTCLAPNEISDSCSSWGKYNNHKCNLEYINWVKNNPENFNLKIRYFFETYYGSWLSLIQQSYDMNVNYQRFCFPVCEKIVNLSLLLGKERSKDNINRGIIKNLVPELDKFRYNSCN